jgi:hypothetical protein
MFGGTPPNRYLLLAHYHQVRDAWGGVRTLDGR